MTDPLTLRSVGLAYRQLSASLAADWAPWYQAATWQQWNALPPLSVARYEDGLFCLEVLEGAARRIFGAKGCPEGKTGCQPGAVRNCDACAGAQP